MEGEQPLVKLTKKQKKALAHRSGGQSSGGGGAGDASKKRSAGKARKALRQNIEALPEADLDEGEGQDAQTVAGESTVEPVKEKKGSNKKRKRIEHTEAEAIEGDEATQGDAKKAKPSRQRFICFCGNLPYTATAEVLKAHFGAACGQEPSVRVLSTKGATPDQVKPKGCAFIEFTNAGALQSALRLHHTLMDKRKINVEISAGGGGKGEKRTTKIEDARKRLGDQRARKAKEKKEKEEKEKAKKGIVDPPVKQPQPQKEKKAGKSFTSGANATKLG